VKVPEIRGFGAYDGVVPAFTRESFCQENFFIRK